MGKTSNLLLVLPRLDLGGDEADAKQIIHSQLVNLCLAASSFEDALLLFDENYELSKQLSDRLLELSGRAFQHAGTRNWREEHSKLFESAQRASARMSLAARDGAITLWHYMTSIRAIKTMLQETPKFRTSHCKMDQIESAIKNFHQHFRHTKGVRDSVAHTAELMKNPSAWKNNSTNRSGSFYLNNLCNRTFQTTTFDGEEVSYDLTEESLDQLISILSQICSAISGGEKRFTA